MSDDTKQLDSHSIGFCASDRQSWHQEVRWIHGEFTLKQARTIQDFFARSVYDVLIRQSDEFLNEDELQRIKDLRSQREESVDAVKGSFDKRILEIKGDKLER